MATGGTLASAGGPRPPAETGIARAETLGPDGGQRTWKPGPDAAVGQTGAQESMPILFPSPAPSSGNNSGGRGGGPRGMDEEGGRPGAGTRHATPPPAGAAAGGRARTIAPYAAPPNGATLKDNNTGLDGGIPLYYQHKNASDINPDTTLVGMRAVSQPNHRIRRSEPPKYR